MIYEFDDFGSNHIISDMCRTRDCRSELDQLHIINPAFKVTLFTVPGEMTPELYNWVGANSDWVHIAWHGFYHTSNYECEKMTYQEFDDLMNSFSNVALAYEKGFRAPGWQVSDDIYKWLYDHDFWVADQDYNDHRRPEKLKVYKVGSNWHGHVWNCVGNGIEETLEQLKGLVKVTPEFKFISEVV